MEVFWRSKSLEQMSEAEWESLCDGCGLCCLHKITGPSAGTALYTSVLCQQHDPETGRCKVYAERFEKVPGCVKLSRENLAELYWLPPTCAYKKLYEGRELASWHPLVSGSEQSVFDAGVAVVNYYTAFDSEVSQQQLADYVL